MSETVQDAPLSAKETDEMPEAHFADPEGKRFPLYDPKSKKLSAEHVKAAGSYAEKMHNSGELSDGKYHEIIARVNKAKKELKIGEFADDAKKTDSSWEKVRRYDFEAGEIDSTKTNPQGFGLLASGRLTRTGVFVYRNADGTERRELRHPDEVFDKDSLDSLAHATLTDDHPSRVDSNNWRHTAVGHVAGGVKRDGRYVVADLLVQHGDAVDKTKQGRLVEISCGYDCKYDPTPGVYEGERHDGIQREIRYNHVAVGPKGWGRAGPTVRMRIDSATADSGACLGVPVEAISYLRGMTEPATGNTNQDAAQEEIKKLRADNEALKTKLSKAEGDVEGYRTRDTNAAAQKKSAEDSARADAELDERVDAIEAARQFLGRDWKRVREDGKRKSVDEIRREIIKELRPSANFEGKNEAFVAALYEIVVQDAEASGVRTADMQAASSPLMFDAGEESAPRGKRKGKPAPVDEGDEPEDTVEDAAAACTKRMKDAWKTGRYASKIRDAERERERARDKGVH